MFCSRCGTQVPDNAAFCMNCGSPLTNINAPGQQNRQNAGGNDMPYYPPGQPQYRQPGEYPGQPISRVQNYAMPKYDGPIYANQNMQMAQAQQLQPSRPKHLMKDTPIPQKEQVPDPTFTKFVDAPDPPLPFWPLKIVLAIVAIGGAAWSIWQAYKIETLRLLFSGIFENVPGIPFLILALCWLVSACSAFGSKFSKGAAGTSGVCFFIAAGTAFTMNSSYPDLHMPIFAVASGVCALILLVSAAGGVHLNLEEI